MTPSAAPKPAAAGARIPATVVTGFLGAGKTTLIRRLLETSGGARIALVVNEFGELGVDGDILKSCGAPGCEEEGSIVELANGCICCAVADDFIPALEGLLKLDPQPDHIVIETSGLALPQPLIRAFNWPEIRGAVTVDGVVAVVDGPAFADGRFAADPDAVERQRAADESLDHEASLAELFGDQVTAADLIVMSKADLMDPDALASAEAAITARARQGVSVLRGGPDGAAAPVLLGVGAEAETDTDARLSAHERRHHAHDHRHGHDEKHAHDHDHEHEHEHEHHHAHDHHHGHEHDHGDDHHHTHDHDAFDSVILTGPEIRDPAAFAARIAAIAAEEKLLRLKGGVAVAGKPMRLLIQAVGPRVDWRFDRPWAEDEAREATLVAIGFQGLDAERLTARLFSGDA